MSGDSAPCAQCPWTQPGRPDITPDLEASARAGTWFCCHVRLGTCVGAQAEHKRATRGPQAVLCPVCGGVHALPPAG